VPEREMESNLVKTLNSRKVQAKERKEDGELNKTETTRVILY